MEGTTEQLLLTTVCCSIRYYDGSHLLWNGRLEGRGRWERGRRGEEGEKSEKSAQEGRGAAGELDHFAVERRVGRRRRPTWRAGHHGWPQKRQLATALLPRFWRCSSPQSAFGARVLRRLCILGYRTQQNHTICNLQSTLCMLICKIPGARERGKGGAKAVGTEGCAAFNFTMHSGRKQRARVTSREGARSGVTAQRELGGPFECIARTCYSPLPCPTAGAAQNKRKTGVGGREN